MIGVFSWIRNQVRLAVLGGFSDAARELHECDDVPGLLLEHQKEEGETDANEPDALPAPGQPRNGRRVKA